jgi:hypothetical protein
MQQAHPTTTQQIPALGAARKRRGWRRLVALIVRGALASPSSPACC